MTLTSLIAVAATGVVLAGPPCDEHRVAARVVDYLGAPPPVSPEVTTRLEQHDDIWTIRVTVGEAEREFSAPQCATVIDAAAFLIAVTVDPSVADRPAPPAEGAAPAADAGEPSDDVVPEPAAPSSTARPDDDRERTGPPIDPASSESTGARPVERAPGIGLRLGAEVGVDFGALPRAGLFVRPAIGVGGRHFTASAVGAFRTRARARNSVDPSVGGDVGAWSVGARGCWTPTLGQTRLSVPTCGGVEGGQVLADGFGFEAARRTTLPWLGLTVSGGLGYALTPRFALVFRAELGTSPLGGALFIEGLGHVHTIRRVFGRAVLGLQFGLGGDRGNNRAWPRRASAQTP